MITQQAGKAEAVRFRQSLRHEFDQYLESEAARFPQRDRLRIDPHCHDLNSDVTDELWGRILGLPETWLKTKKLVSCLRDHGSDVITVTNHNNARSCWELLDSGQDALVGAEFTCYFPEYELFCHVLTYGFSPEQEAVLNRKRQNIYEFLRYSAENDIPLILPHPLYFYTRNDRVDLELFEKFAVMFQRFEVLNAQRDLWQATLTKNWAQSLDEEKILGFAKKHGLDPSDFGVDPAQPKVLTGGSDDHMGIFAGQSGSWLHVPNLQERLKTRKPSELALEAIRAGRMGPFGDVGENQKLNIALLDYFSQIATRIKDPGLLRILLHRGETSDKVTCFAISNLLLELQRHKHSRKFFEFVHAALQGRKPNKILKWKISRDYQFCIRHLERIAVSKRESPEKFVATVNETITGLFTELNRLIIKRVKGSGLVSQEMILAEFSTEEFTRKFEIPSQISALAFGSKRRSDMSGVNYNQLIGLLSFPVLISVVLTGAMMASTRVLYQNRQFLNRFAARLGKNQHEERALHLTDTLLDKNGVSNSLSGKLREIQRHDLPIDFLICHESAEPADHLHVVRPLTSFMIGSTGQEIRIPDLMQVARLFYEGGYDRVVCSTEGPMVLVSLFLRYMFNVPCYFFMHTDWIEFIRCTTKATRHERDRIRRFLRMLYGQFDGLFVLNSEHREWLSGHQMNIDPEKIHLASHHVEAADVQAEAVPRSELFPGVAENTPVLFIACRLSAEKGIFELPEIMAAVRKKLPDARLVIAGTGPAEQELKNQLPDALFLGWVDRQKLAQMYASLDLFVFPSRFDTFGNVVLEAFSHGMPVIAYDCKGPRDIIEHGRCGYLVNDVEQMADQIVRHFQWPDRRAEMRQHALDRASQYNADAVMGRFMKDLGLPAPDRDEPQRFVA